VCRCFKANSLEGATNDAGRYRIDLRLGGQWRTFGGELLIQLK
jgi:hypothetical protein